MYLPSWLFFHVSVTHERLSSAANTRTRTLDNKRRVLYLFTSSSGSLRVALARSAVQQRSAVRSAANFFRPWGGGV